jgi:hypothetical protein
MLFLPRNKALLYLDAYPVDLAVQNFGQRRSNSCTDWNANESRGGKWPKSAWPRSMARRLLQRASVVFKSWCAAMTVKSELISSLLTFSLYPTGYDAQKCISGQQAPDARHFGACRFDGHRYSERECLCFHVKRSQYLAAHSGACGSAVGVAFGAIALPFVDAGYGRNGTAVFSGVNYPL